MLHTLKLFLPALIPSWRFFDVITAAPTIEFACLAAPDDAPDWREFRPRPEKISAIDVLKRLVWNPRWNEQLFLVSCAERLLENPTGHSVNEIRTRIRNDLGPASPYLQFRIVLRARQDGQIQHDIAYISPVYPA